MLRSRSFGQNLCRVPNSAGFIINRCVCVFGMVHIYRHHVFAQDISFSIRLANSAFTELNNQFGAFIRGLKVFNSFVERHMIAPRTFK